MSIEREAAALAAELTSTPADWVEVLKAILEDRPLHVSTPADAADRAREWWREDQDGVGPLGIDHSIGSIFRALANFQRGRIMAALLYARDGG